jgi:uncharacterized membrane protein
LAAVSAMVYGSADYCGGVATRKAPAVVVTVLSQMVVFPVLLGAAFVVGGTPGPRDAGWGALAGAAGLAGLVLLYRGLSSGAMAVVAPITAVTAALVPLAVGLVLEQRPGVVALTGISFAVVAIGLVSLTPGRVRGQVTPGLLTSATVAGVMFGLFFIGLDRTGPDAGMWPLVWARLTAVGLGLVLAMRLRVGLTPDRAVWPWIIGAGVLDVSANVSYLLAAQLGTLSIVAPIAGLYPVSTVLLALTVDRERLRPLQVVGLGLAATALVLVSGTG